jgi:hypothetical protein
MVVVVFVFIRGTNPYYAHIFITAKKQLREEQTSGRARRIEE